MLFFYLILILLSILIFIILGTTIQIHIENIKFTTDKKYKTYLNKNYKIRIKLYFLQKIKFLSLNMTKNKIEKMNIQKRINKIEKKFIKGRKKIDTKMLKQLKHLKAKIKKINLKIDLGLEDAAKTAICVGVISTSIAILLRKAIDKKSENFWKIEPIYQNRNVLNINLNCIISLKLIHIIYTIYVLKMKGAEKNGTSNRRAYAHSHE